MPDAVTIAIPTRNAGSEFRRTLAAVRSQRAEGREVELLICDSGSSDDTVALARAHGAEIIEIAPERFSHGATRNLLMSEARGEHVAFLTQDAVPAAADWLERLLAAFDLAPDVGLAFGPYQPRPAASLSVRRELTSWFDSFSDGGPRVDVLGADDRDAPPRRFMGHLGFFTDANGCVAREAWRRVPFREVAYAEDHLLAQDMLRAGFAKVYVPGAPVVHSHDYSPSQWLRRSFDEARAIRDVYEWAPGGRAVLRTLRGNVSGDWRWSRGGGAVDGGGGAARAGPVSVIAGSLCHHGARALGGWLGSHAERLPSSVVARLSLEGRA